MMPDTYASLYGYMQELSQSQNSIFFRLFRNQINHFYKHNSGRINEINAGIIELSKKYFEFENSKAKYIGDGSQRKRVLLEGKTEEEYKEALNVFLQKPCKIVFL